jgi:hypothetical protein
MFRISVLLATIGIFPCNCSSTVPVVPANKPVTVTDKPVIINPSVKIEDEIRARVERELEDVINKKSGLF